MTTFGFFKNNRMHSIKTLFSYSYHRARGWRSWTWPASWCKQGHSPKHVRIHKTVHSWLATTKSFNTGAYQNAKCLKIFFLRFSLCILDFPFLKPLYNNESEIKKSFNLLKSCQHILRFRQHFSWATIALLRLWCQPSSKAMRVRADIVNHSSRTKILFTVTMVFSQHY